MDGAQACTDRWFRHMDSSLPHGRRPDGEYSVTGTAGERQPQGRTVVNDLPDNKEGMRHQKVTRRPSMT